MTGHKFAVGQQLIFNSRLRTREPTMVRVIRLLPVEREGLTYRIKSAADGCERVAYEHELHGVEEEALAQ